jgi:hypothetical protein
MDQPTPSQSSIKSVPLFDAYAPSRIAARVRDGGVTKAIAGTAATLTPRNQLCRLRDVQRLLAKVKTSTCLNSHMPDGQYQESLKAVFKEERDHENPAGGGRFEIWAVGDGMDFADPVRNDSTGDSTTRD